MFLFSEGWHTIKKSQRSLESVLTFLFTEANNAFLLILGYRVPGLEGVKIMAFLVLLQPVCEGGADSSKETSIFLRLL